MEWCFYVTNLNGLRDFENSLIVMFLMYSAVFMYVKISGYAPENLEQRE